MKILVIEDDPEIIDVIDTLVKVALPESKLATATTGKRALEMLTLKEPDIVLLDLGLPDINGFDLLSEIRTFSTVPILIVTVRGEENDIVRGLTLGANDYVVKPFKQMELLARIRNQLTRQHPTSEDLDIVFEDLRFGTSLHELFIGEKRVCLTITEGRIFHLLMKHPNKIVTFKEIAECLWGEYYDEARDSIKTYICRLRKKIEADPSRPQRILTQNYQGYILKELEKRNY